MAIEALPAFAAFSSPATPSPCAASLASASHCSAVGATFGTLSHQANWRTSPSARGLAAAVLEPSSAMPPTKLDHHPDAPSTAEPPLGVSDDRNSEPVPNASANA